ncbi:hypothetical protein SKAU_G00043140 [Synaphobranchus kaupii]|uniref:Uncharacterized protein n=1 Tax=Synaphobranchus kaupii TaxID=118154 RepID=A0A9Q1G2I9_SYNKA|nr:hypothetical protein SKAU_G00043140 [Synaphobranchus kaupii]
METYLSNTGVWGVIKEVWRLWRGRRGDFWGFPSHAPHSDIRGNPSSIQISTAWLPRLDPLLDTRPRHLHRYCSQHFKRDQEPSKEQ